MKNEEKDSKVERIKDSRRKWGKMKGKVRMIKVEKEKKDNEELKEKRKKLKRKFCFKNQGGKERGKN